MATATKKGPAGGSRRPVADRASLAFVISQDNGGHYLWEIVDSGGNAVVQSGGFASRDEAERAAHDAHNSARLAHFGGREADAPPLS